MTKDTQKKNKRLEGTVVSDAMDKTITVLVDRFVKHPKYGKFYTLSKKYKVHDAENIYKKGDRVTIESCRPISKDKSFRVVAEITNNA